MKRVALGAIGAYRRWLSPALPRRCRYEPSCSAYAAEAVRRFGAARGLLLAAWRLLRCHPFSHGGFDPVPPRFTLRVGPVDPAEYHGEARTGSPSKNPPRTPGGGGPARCSVLGRANSAAIRAFLRSCLAWPGPRQPHTRSFRTDS